MVDVACAWSRVLRSSVVQSILALRARMQVRSIFSAGLDRNALEGLDVDFRSFPSFKPHFDTNDVQHNKTLKQTKTLDINKTKSLTNIS